MKTVFVGSKELGYAVLKKAHELYPFYAAITIEDGEDSRSHFSEIWEFCKKEKNLGFSIANTRQGFKDLILDMKPDLVFVVGWYWLIDKELLDKSQFIGIHNSLLPKYRGGSPLVWAMINGEEKTGFSVFSFDEGMDTGPIWYQERIEIGKYDSISGAMDRIQYRILSFLENYYIDMVMGKISPDSQEKDIVSTYCAQRFPEDGEIDWNWSAKRIYDFIRAQSDPYPGAFTYLSVFDGAHADGVRNDKVYIWSAGVGEFQYYGTPGQVTRIGNGCSYIICGDQLPLLVRVISVGGGDRISGDKVLNSNKIRLGRKGSWS